MYIYESDHFHIICTICWLMVWYAQLTKMFVSDIYWVCILGEVSPYRRNLFGWFPPQNPSYNYTIAVCVLCILRWIAVCTLCRAYTPTSLPVGTLCQACTPTKFIASGYIHGARSALPLTLLPVDTIPLTLLPVGTICQACTPTNQSKHISYLRFSCYASGQSRLHSYGMHTYYCNGTCYSLAECPCSCTDSQNLNLVLYGRIC